MIKIFKFLYINPLTLILILLFYFNRHINLLIMSYTIMIIHELCHLLAAICIGLRPAYLAIHPFGICLKLQNRIVRSISDEIILYMAGPLSNIAMALTVKILPANNMSEFLYYSNIILFITNMLPILPLDGGVIAKRILTYRFGEKKSKSILIFISILLCGAMIFEGLYLVYINSFNYSVIVLAVMTTGNIFTQKEKYNIDYTKELMYYSTKKNLSKKNIRVVMHEKNDDLRKTVSEFRPNDYSVVCVVDSNNNVIEWLTEKKILDLLLTR